MSRGKKFRRVLLTLEVDTYVSLDYLRHVTQITLVAGTREPRGGWVVGVEQAQANVIRPESAAKRKRS